MPALVTYPPSGFLFLSKPVKDILGELYQNSQVDECIAKIIPSQDREDFKQELFLILLEKQGNDIVFLHEQGKLVFYVVRIILNLSRQERNVYHKLYRDKNIDYDTEKVLYARPPSDFDTMGERIAREKREEQLLEEINGIDARMGKADFPYHEMIVRMVAELGSMSEVSRQIGIPTCTISRATKKVRTYLNENVPPKNHP